MSEAQSNDWNAMELVDIDADTPACGHWGSSRTMSRSDGDLECMDCPGITVTSCEVCETDQCECGRQ